MFPGPGCLSEIRVVFLQFFDIADKVKQPLIACFLIIFRLLYQHGKVCLPSLPGRHGSRIFVVSCPIKDTADQSGDRKIQGFSPKIRKQIHKGLQLPEDHLFFALFPGPGRCHRFIMFPMFFQIVLHCPIESDIFPAVRIPLKVRHHNGKLPILHSADRRFQHSG